MTENTLYFGDNLQVLRAHFPDACVDLIYLDPPFNSKRNYNVVFNAAATSDDTAQAHAFSDTWSFEGAAEAFYEVTALNQPVSKLLEGLRQTFGDTSLLGYLSVMALRLIELHRVLRPTGSLYLHCDPTASHYLKLVLDALFGEARFVNEVTWRRTSSHNDSRKQFGWVSDTLLVYAKSPSYVFNVLYGPYSEDYVKTFYVHSDPDGRRWRRSDLRSPNPRPNLTYDYVASNERLYRPHPNGWAVSLERMKQLDAEGRLHFPAKEGGRLQLKRYLDEQLGQPVGCVWDDIPPIHALTAERLGYPTQKPLALLERIIAASSNEGDLVLDPFCGCGTAVAAAQKLGRKWCGIDITTLAVSLIKRRLLEHFPDAFPAADAIPVVGFPADVAGARTLAETDRYAFEHWALTLIGAAPAGGGATKKKGADRGIDGEFTWRDEKDTLCRGLVSVKSGHVNVTHIRDLIGTMGREKADLGVYVCLEEPTKPMRTEAAGAGRYKVTGMPKDFPRVQLVTVEDLLAGREPDVPRWRANPFREAQKIIKQEQETLSFDEED